jgi:bifunctional non-homologous end joining protein LigD
MTALASTRQALPSLASGGRQMLTVEGHRLALTHLEKVLYPATSTTKSDVLSYYAAVADVLLLHVVDRPVTRKRWVDGVGTENEPRRPFFQKNLEGSAPSWLKHRTIRHRDHSNEYLLVDGLATLLWLGQTATLEIHVPQWKFGRGGARKHPDRFVLDLDPGEGVGLPQCAHVAHLARKALGERGLESVPVTSGSKGIHLYVALEGTQNADTVNAAAHALARELETRHPDLVVSDMSKELRRGKVFVDWSQNHPAKTTIAPYSLRGQHRPTVAAPRTWNELSAPDLRQLELHEVLALLERRGDPLAGLVPGRLPTPGASSARRAGDPKA